MMMWHDIAAGKSEGTMLVTITCSGVHNIGYVLEAQSVSR